MRAAGFRFAAQLRPCDVRPVLAVLRQPWYAAVAAHAAMARPDVLVLADAGGGPWAAWRWRAHLRALLACTECDLLLSRAPEPPAPARRRRDGVKMCGIAAAIASIIRARHARPAAPPPR